VALSYYRLGRLAEGAAAARSVHENADDIGDATSSGIALSAWTRCVVGRVDGGRIGELLGRGTDDAHTGCELHLAAALQLRAEGQLEPARAQLEAGLALRRRAGLRQEYVAPLLPWYATVLREQVEAWPAHDASGRAQALRRARGAARRARWWAVSYRNNAPHALREAALVSSLRGRRGTALRLLARSGAVAGAQGARYEAALTAAAAAQLGPCTCRGVPSSGGGLGRVHALEALDTGDEAVAPTASFSLFDRFTTLLKVGRQIAAATTFEALESAVRDAGLTLLRGERCHLVQVAHLGDHR
jgi:two-component system sensor kinase